MSETDLPSLLGSPTKGRAVISSDGRQLCFGGEPIEKGFGRQWNWLLYTLPSFCECLVLLHVYLLMLAMDMSDLSM